MIPGNRPEDEAEEAFWETFAEKLETKTISTSTGSTSETVIAIDDLWDDPDFVKVVQTSRDIGYQRGYNEGQAEAEMALGALEGDIAEHMHHWLEDQPTASAKSYLNEAAKYRRKLQSKD
jgi:hypothetical protein